VVAGLNPVILLVNEPLPAPSVVKESESVGCGEVLQHTPLAVTAAPPFEVTLPPEVAVVWVTADGWVVVTVVVQLKL
jgi:hypothetical protein